MEGFWRNLALASMLKRAHPPAERSDHMIYDGERGKDDPGVDGIFTLSPQALIVRRRREPAHDRHRIHQFIVPLLGKQSRQCFIIALAGPFKTFLQSDLIPQMQSPAFPEIPGLKMKEKTVLLNRTVGGRYANFR